MKVDLTMWAKDGAEFLPSVLKRVDEVIPRESVNKKIFVDDHSTDNSVEIAERHGWKVYENKHGGVNEGANIALSHVTTPFFVSVEQDILLNREWWEKIPPYMKDPKVAIAQGIRLPTNNTLRSIEKYTYKRLLNMDNNIDKYVYEKVLSIDNNIYRTDLIRKFGGFHPSPKDFRPCLPSRMGKKNDAKYKWIIDKNVISGHIRDSVWEHGLHMYKMHYKFVKKAAVEELLGTRPLKIFLFSPLRAFHIALKEQCPSAVFAYPFLRFMVLKAVIDKRKMKGPTVIYMRT